MLQIDHGELGLVFGGESFGEVAKAVRANSSVPLDQTYRSTIDFIGAHPFFHQGLMNAPIGGGKHFRNVPFVGPKRVVTGAVTGDREELLKGVEVTRGTWDAP
jgi:hypothetical protein